MALPECRSTAPPRPCRHDRGPCRVSHCGLAGSLALLFGSIFFVVQPGKRISLLRPDHSATAFAPLESPLTVSLPPPPPLPLPMTLEPSGPPAASVSASGTAGAHACSGPGGTCSSVDIGEMPGSWNGTVWVPQPCAACGFVTVDYISSLTAGASVPLLNRTIFFLGDSLLRDAVIEMQALVAADLNVSGKLPWPVATREEAKADCYKYTARESACSFTMGSSSLAVFHWFQWFAPAHRPRDLTFEQAQEYDICSSYGNSSSAVAACIADYVLGAAARDVLVIRAGLNYLLFEAQLPDGVGLEAAFEADVHTFFAAVATGDLHFPGQLVFMLLAPTMAAEVGQESGKCAGVGVWDKIMWDITPKAQALNRIIKPYLIRAGIPFIDPFAYLPGAADAFYKDCVHPLPFVQRVTANVLLNILRSHTFYRY